ncbi:hypothetical protein FHS57_005794 [Runella defluvii]|uniref:Uncharacterized protein n=1 Tax=Runella defluvii TaxID=370973 RepID=A0A7W5ZS61_9BACT|nr:hypothetical protein [Runella defluvii]
MVLITSAIAVLSTVSNENSFTPIPEGTLSEKNAKGGASTG